MYNWYWIVLPFPSFFFACQMCLVISNTHVKALLLMVFKLWPMLKFLFKQPTLTPTPGLWHKLPGHTSRLAKNVSANQRSWRSSWFSDRCNLVKDVGILLPVRFRRILFSGYREVETISANHLGFPISPKNTNSVKDVEVLLPADFHQILFNSCKRESETVSTRGQGCHLNFQIGSKKSWRGR